MIIDYRGRQSDQLCLHFDRFRWMVPGWCEKLTLVFEDLEDSELTYACADVNYNYRQATITFYPRWLALDDQGRDNTMIHELLHILLSPLDGVYERCGLDKLKTAMIEESTEQVVSDIAYAIQRMLDDE